MAASHVSPIWQASFFGIGQRLRQCLGYSLPARAWVQLLSAFLGLLLLSLGNAAMALQRGDQGESVSELQTQLTTAGCYTGPITGYFGELTQAGVIQCQANYGLPQDGIAGTQTIAALTGDLKAQERSANPEAALQRGSRGDRVVQIQRQLATLGYYSGEIDGIFGRLTEAAVTRFQQESQLPMTGIVGRQDMQVLDRRVANHSSQANSTASQPISRSQLAQGDYGSEVGQLQRRLKELGFFEPSVTEYYGDLTQAAVSDFQRNRGIPSSGIADTRTLEALNLRSATSAPSPERAIVPTQPARNQDSSSPFNSQPFTANPAPSSAAAQSPPSGNAQPFTSQPFTTARNSTPVQTLNWNEPRYVVVIPKQSGVTLTQVRRIWSQAIEQSSPKGTFIQAGVFSKRSDADRQSQLLRAYGLDARVDYR